MDKALVLTPAQQKAFSTLEKAFDACKKSGLEIHGEMRTLYAINSRGLKGRSVTSGEGYEINDDSDHFFTPDCFHGCSADDGLSFTQ
jgi:hypothetical protein